MTHLKGEEVEEVEVQEPENKQHIDDLCQEDQMTLLYMTMESLRGSWSQPRQRTKIVHYLAEELPEDSFEDISMDAIRRSAKRFKHKFSDLGKYQDGRTFRKYYQDINYEEISHDRRTIGYLSSLLMNDLSWDQYKIDKFCGEGDSNG